MSKVGLVKVQERGQVTLPASVRRSFGIEKGDVVAVTATEKGILITPQKVVAADLLDQIGAALKERGLTLEELIESGREERGDLLREMYGLDAEQTSTLH
jgi:AbrB family looped-hinge helix DNA binding protein